MSSEPARQPSNALGGHSPSMGAVISPLQHVDENKSPGTGGLGVPKCMQNDAGQSTPSTQTESGPPDHKHGRQEHQVPPHDLGAESRHSAPDPPPRCNMEIDSSSDDDETKGFRSQRIESFNKSREAPWTAYEAVLRTSVVAQAPER